MNYTFLAKGRQIVINSAKEHSGAASRGHRAIQSEIKVFAYCMEEHPQPRELGVARNHRERHRWSDANVSDIQCANTFYLAYSMTRDSRITVTFTSPGTCISDVIRLAISLAML